MKSTISSASPLSGAAPIRIGNSVVWPNTGVVEVSGHTERLRRKELELVSYLHQNASRVVSRDELLSNVWNYSALLTRTVDQTIATLRRKLKDDHRNPRHVITVHGVGYMLKGTHAASSCGQ